MSFLLHSQWARGGHLHTMGLFRGTLRGSSNHKPATCCHGQIEKRAKDLGSFSGKSEALLEWDQISSEPKALALLPD